MPAGVSARHLLVLSCGACRPQRRGPASSPETYVSLCAKRPELCYLCVGSCFAVSDPPLSLTLPAACCVHCGRLCVSSSTCPPPCVCLCFCWRALCLWECVCVGLLLCDLISVSVFVAAFLSVSVALFVSVFVHVSVHVAVSMSVAVVCVFVCVELSRKRRSS